MPPGVGAGVAGLSDLVGLFTGLQQQSAENAAITQTGNEVQQGVGQLQSEGGQLFGNYTANAQPAENAIIQQMPGEIAGYQGAAAGDYGAEAGLGGTLAASPYPGMIQGEGSQFMTYPTPTIGSEISNARALQNWQGLKPKELGQATTVASDAAESAAQTMKAQMGGVANPGAVMEQLGNQASKAGMETALGLGSMAQQQELGAKEAAGQELATAAGQQIQQVSGQVGATEAAGSQYASDITGAGGLLQGAGAGEAGLAGQDITQLLNALSTEAGMAQTGIGAQGTATGDLMNLLQTELGITAGQGNPFTNFGSSIMDLFGGGGGQVGGGPAGPPQTSDPNFNYWMQPYYGPGGPQPYYQPAA